MGGALGMKKSFKLTKKLTTRRIFILGLVAAALGIGVYLGYSWLAWESYETKYKDYEKQTRSSLEKTLQHQVSKQYSVKDKLLDVRRQSLMAIESSREACRPQPATGWLTAVQTYADKQRACQKVVGELRRWAEGLYDSSLDIEFENNLANIVTAAISKSKSAQDPDDWASAQAAWADAASQLAELSTPSDKSEQLKSRAGTLIDKIEAAWRGLVDVNEVEDEAKYSQAIEKLEQSYLDLQALLDS